MKSAVIYLRVSTDKQADKDHDPEGYSIPAQRDACLRKAESLEAEVVDEYLDRGESARSADRPALQLLLKRLREQRDVAYVIVHKLDRLARSREDDVKINLGIRQAGATLVSATENIDQTASGRLVHGIMATIAEFYSANLATEAVKGMTQKAKTGGTPGRAPVGYINAPEIVNGREVRSVAVDPDRAPHVQWAFESYATGDWTIQDLVDELERRGLRSRPQGRSPSLPLHYSRVAHLLGNRYYLGIVTFNGVEYVGRHQPLVSLDTFERVQEVLRSRRHAGEKRRVHHHYLKGTVFCRRCHSRLCLTLAKGHGGQYLYFFCIGRQRGNGCRQRYTSVETVEAAVARFYGTVQLEPARVELIREQLNAQLEVTEAVSARETEQQTQRLARLKDERLKLLQAHYAGAIPLDLLRSEQDRISRETAEAERLLAAGQLQVGKIAEGLDQALSLASDCQRAYELAPGPIRRMFNQSFFDHLWFDDGEVKGADLAEPFATILAQDFVERLSREAAGPTGLFLGQGSSQNRLVPPAGLEPATRCLEGSRSIR